MLPSLRYPASTLTNVRTSREGSDSLKTRLLEEDPRCGSKIGMPRDSRDIMFFVLAMLAAVAVLSFVWAGIRISEIRASASSGAPSAMVQ